MTTKVLYLLVNPVERRVVAKQCSSLDEAVRAAGLSPNEVDHGALDNGHSIVVFEYGLVKPVEQQRLFAIGQCLFEGNAVIYAEADGKSVDAHWPVDAVVWFKNITEVWDAIERGEVIQPSMSVDGETLWLWPDQKIR